MIARHWRGLAKAARADDYVAHLRAQTLPRLRELPGFAGAEILRRETARGTEFVVITRWESLEAIAAFAGSDTDSAVVPALAQAMMVEHDDRARHYTVID